MIPLEGALVLPFFNHSYLKTAIYSPIDSPAGICFFKMTKKKSVNLVLLANIFKEFFCLYFKVTFMSQRYKLQTKKNGSIFFFIPVNNQF